VLGVGVEPGPDREVGVLVGRPVRDHQPSAEEDQGQPGHQGGETVPPGRGGGVGRAAHRNKHETRSYQTNGQKGDVMKVKTKLKAGPQMIIGGAG
jgi:hypothetical protein